MCKTVDKAALIVSGIAAATSVVAAIFAYGQVKAAKDNTWRSLRAYIAVQTPTIHFKVGDPVVASVELSAAGQTPAYNLVVRYYLTGGDAHAPTLADLDKRGNIVKTDLRRFSFGPTEKIPLSTTSWTPTKNDAGTYLQGGASKIYYIGSIKYSDMFGCAHELTYCFSFAGEELRGNALAGSCEGDGYNNSDDPSECLAGRK